MGPGAAKAPAAAAALAVRRDRPAADTVLRWESGGLSKACFSYFLLLLLFN